VRLVGFRVVIVSFLRRRGWFKK